MHYIFCSESEVGYLPLLLASIYIAHNLYYSTHFNISHIIVPMAILVSINNKRTDQLPQLRASLPRRGTFHNHTPFNMYCTLYTHLFLHVYSPMFE